MSSGQSAGRGYPVAISDLNFVFDVIVWKSRVKGFEYIVLKRVESVNVAKAGRAMPNHILVPELILCVEVLSI